MIGLVRDLYESESLTDFLADLSNALVPGKYAVLVGAKEDRSTPVDIQMKELGGSVFRTTKSTAIREHRTQQTKRFKAELDALIGELAEGHGNVKERLQTAIERVRTHLTQKIIEDADFPS